MFGCLPASCDSWRAITVMNNDAPSMIRFGGGGRRSICCLGIFVAPQTWSPSTLVMSYLIPRSPFHEYCPEAHTVLQQYEYVNRAKQHPGKDGLARQERAGRNISQPHSARIFRELARGAALNLLHANFGKMFCIRLRRSELTYRLK